MQRKDEWEILSQKEEKMNLLIIERDIGNRLTAATAFSLKFNLFIVENFEEAEEKIELEKITGTIISLSGELDKQAGKEFASKLEQAKIQYVFLFPREKIVRIFLNNYWLGQDNPTLITSSKETKKCWKDAWEILGDKIKKSQSAF